MFLYKLILNFLIVQGLKPNTYKTNDSPINLSCMLFTTDVSMLTHGRHYTFKHQYVCIVIMSLFEIAVCFPLYFRCLDFMWRPTECLLCEMKPHTAEKLAALKS